MARTQTRKLRDAVAALIPAIEGTFAGYRVECAVAGEVSRFGATVDVRVFHGAEEVGGGRRSVLPGHRIRHIGLDMGEHRGNGFGRAWLPHCFEQYRRHRFERVDVSSGATHVWGRLGFEWANPGSPELVGALVAAADVVAGERGPSAELDALRLSLAAQHTPAAAEIAASDTGVEVLRHVIAPMVHHLR